MDSNPDRRSSHSMGGKSNEDTSGSNRREILMQKSIGMTSRHESNMDSVDSNKSDKVKNHDHNDNGLMCSGERKDHEQVRLHIPHTTVLLHNL